MAMLMVMTIDDEKTILMTRRERYSVINGSFIGFSHRSRFSCGNNGSKCQISSAATTTAATTTTTRTTTTRTTTTRTRTTAN